MSCDVAVAAFLMFANASPAALNAAPVPAIAAPAPVAGEPLFADIVGRAGKLKSVVDGYRTGLAKSLTLPGFDGFKTDIAALAALDLKGHETLKARNTDGDLKCILRGISQDLPLKLDQVEKAADLKAKDKALKEMSYLLNDNVEVITAPPAPEV
ncbi:hypothetical protein BH11PSE2_BH11PSE2_01380 [soil metagenome]